MFLLKEERSYKILDMSAELNNYIYIFELKETFYIIYLFP